MKLQFSLATLLICMTVLAVVAAICSRVLITETLLPNPFQTPNPFEPDGPLISRPPTVGEIALRMSLWGPASIVVSLGALWVVRRFRTRSVQ
jgi:hypothetical protein